MARPTYARQVFWSLIAAALIVVLVVVGVTVRLGPDAGGRDGSGRSGHQD